MNEVYDFFGASFVINTLKNVKPPVKPVIYIQCLKSFTANTSICPFITEEINELIFKDGSLMDL